MFSLDVRRPPVRFWPMLLAIYLSLPLFQMVAQRSWNVPALLLLLAVICLLLGAFRDRILGRSMRVLFTSEGVASRQFNVIPWDNIHHVRFYRRFFVRAGGLPLWVLEIHQEPDSFLFKRRNMLTRTFGQKLRFQISATEEEAKGAVAELRRRCSRAWRIRDDQA